MIRIICCTCGTTQGYKTETDGALTLPAAEERRLVSRGVAEYVTRPIIGPASGADRPADGGSDTPAGDLPGSAEAVDIIDGHFDRESLLQLTRFQLERLAGDLGVDISRCRNKGDIAELLVKIELDPPSEDSGEVPPDLGAEEPVV